MRLSIEDWKRLCKDAIYKEWAYLDWPGAIGIDYHEAKEYAEKVLGKGPVIIDFTEDELMDCLCELEEDIADMKGQEKFLDF